MFGGPADEAASKRLVDIARDAGINFIDTANTYNAGASEEVVGRAIHGDRNRWVLATKVNGVMGSGPNERGSSRLAIMEQAKRSLDRLGTDYIDIYYLHREDFQVPLDETVRAMGDLARAGLIRYFAVSNHRTWRLAEICNICDRLGIDRPFVQPALLQRGQPGARGRASAGLRFLRAWRGALQPAGAWRPDRQSTTPTRRRPGTAAPRARTCG